MTEVHSSFLEELHDYFAGIENPSEEEENFLDQISIYQDRASVKVVDSYGDLPDGIREQVEKALTRDILVRYDNSSYHNEDIIHNTLQDLGYKIKD